MNAPRNAPKPPSNTIRDVLREPVEDLPKSAVHPQADAVVGHGHAAAASRPPHADRETEVVDDRCPKRLVPSGGPVRRRADEHSGAPARGEPALRVGVDPERGAEKVRHGEIRQEGVLPEALHLEPGKEREKVELLALQHRDRLREGGRGVHHVRVGEQDQLAPWPGGRPGRGRAACRASPRAARRPKRPRGAECSAARRARISLVPSVERSSTTTTSKSG